MLELRFLLKLLGVSGYRAPLSRIQLYPRIAALQRHRICQQLRDRGLVACSTDVVRVAIAPPGKALLKLDLPGLPISDAEFQVLRASAEQAITPGKTGLPSPERQTVIQGLADRGLIQVETKIKDVWITQQGQTFLRDTYTPKGKAGISLDLLRNYLHLLRQSLIEVDALPNTVAARTTVAALPTDAQVLQLIQALDHELGTKNYLPLFYLRQKIQPPLSRDEVDQSLYRLQRSDRIELSSLQEAIAYTPRQVEAGIPQDIGGPLFFISINQ